MEAFRNQFSHRLSELLDTHHMSQNHLAEQVGVSRSTVTGWVRHGKLPDVYILMKICDVFGCSSDWLIGLENHYEKRNLAGQVGWLESIPPFLEGFQREHIEQGVRIFNDLLNEDIATSEIINDRNLRYLQFALQAALRSGAIRVTDVQQDHALEAQIKAKYPYLKHVIVADVPANCDATLIRAELVSFLAATKVMSTVIRENVIGLGTGFTMLRMCEQSVPSIDQFKGTQWLPLVTFTNDNESGYTANQLARLMQLRHPGSQATYLPHPTLIEKDSLLADAYNSATQLMQNVQTMFMTVNGVGRRDRTLKTHPLTDFRTVDYAFDSAFLRDKYAELGDKQEFGGEILSYLIDTDGHVIDWDQDRVWAINLDVLRYNSDLVGKVVVVAARDYKAQAVETCIKSGLCNAIVIDNEIARYLVH